MTYKAAVIIPTRGGAAKLHYPLDALEKQTETDFQVLVVCDGDIDGSAQVVETYKERGILNIEAIVFEKNQGRSKALNAGHRAADAEILIRCDDDLEPRPDYIEQHLRFHGADHETGVIGLVHNKFPDTPHARIYGCYRDQKFRQDAYARPKEEHWHYWNANASLSKKMFEQLGGYDERYRLYGWEDVDMGRMLFDAGVEIIIAPELEADHHIAATTTAMRATRALHSGAARDIFVKKHGAQVLSSPAPRGAWGNAVKILSHICTEKNITQLGNGIDKIAAYIPANVAEKLMALLIESASYAGIMNPSRAQKVF